MNQKMTDSAEMHYSKGNIVSIFGFGPDDSHYENDSADLAKEYIGYQAHILHLQPGQTDGLYAGSFEMLNGPAQGEIVMFADVALSPWMTSDVADTLGLPDGLDTDLEEGWPETLTHPAERVLTAIHDRIHAEDLTQCLDDVEWMIDHYRRHGTLDAHFTSDPGYLTAVEKQERVDYLRRYGAEPEPAPEPEPEPEPELDVMPDTDFGEGDKAIIVGFGEGDSYDKQKKGDAARRSERIGSQVLITNVPHRNGPDPDAYACDVFYLTGPLTGENDVFYQVYLAPVPEDEEGPTYVFNHGDEAIINRIGESDVYAYVSDRRTALESQRVRLDGAMPHEEIVNAYRGSVQILSGPEKGERRYFREVYLRPVQTQTDDLLYDRL